MGLRERGLTYGAIAAQTGPTQIGVFNIRYRFATAGMAGLASQPRGLDLDVKALLQAGQKAEIRTLICQHTPDALGLPFALRSRAAVRALVWDRPASVDTDDAFARGVPDVEDSCPLRAGVPAADDRSGLHRPRSD